MTGDVYCNAFITQASKQLGQETYTAMRSLLKPPNIWVRRLTLQCVTQASKQFNNSIMSTSSAAGRMLISLVPIMLTIRNISC